MNQTKMLLKKWGWLIFLAAFFGTQIDTLREYYLGPPAEQSLESISQPLRDEAQKLPPVEKNFHVRFEQDGYLIEPMNHEVTLNKEEFSMVFELSEPMGVLVNASFDDDTYALAAQGNPKDLLPGFRNTGMAEVSSNPDREILLSYDSPNYWHYDVSGESRFNEVEMRGHAIIGKRTLRNFYDVDSDRSTGVEAVSQPLYLVFISSKWETQTFVELEIKREYVKVNWRE
ncbi:MAG: hypothetical protein Q8P95_01250 [bacterium]|nr:hypothetical protein [bacterium]